MGSRVEGEPAANSKPPSQRLINYSPKTTPKGSQQVALINTEPLRSTDAIKFPLSLLPCGEKILASDVERICRNLAAHPLIFKYRFLY